MPDDADPAEARRLDDLAQALNNAASTIADLVVTMRGLRLAPADLRALRLCTRRGATRRSRRRIDGR